MIFEIDSSVELGSNRTPRLKANEIHKVQLKEIKSEDLTGKDGRTYPVIYMKFENAEGETYEHRFFAPTETVTLIDGKFGSQPSDYTQFRYTIQHFIEELNPNLFTQIKNGKKFSLNNWNEMRIWVVKALTHGLNVDTELKLVADNKGYATIPKYPVGLNKSNELYLKTRFIGKNLVFTAAEKKTMEKQKELAAATPTSMSSANLAPSPKPSTTDDFDV